MAGGVFRPEFLSKRYAPRPIPGYFETYADAWLWWRFIGQATTQDEMHRAFPHWFGPACLVTDPGPLDATEP